MNMIRYILSSLSSINGIKQILFGIFLVLIAIWSWTIGSESSGSTVLAYLAFFAPIIGAVFAISGLMKKDK